MVTSGTDATVDWLFHDADYGLTEFMASVDAVVMGRKTWELVDRQILAVVNFPPRQIGKHLSKVLTLGVPDENGNVILLRTDRDVPLGSKLY